MPRFEIEMPNGNCTIYRDASLKGLMLRVDAIEDLEARFNERKIALAKYIEAIQTEITALMPAGTKIYYIAESKIE